MSAFHLTFSYLSAYVVAGKEAADLSLKQKGLILKILILLFLFSVSANIFFAGAVVSKNAEGAALAVAASETILENEKMEAMFASANYGANLEYFLAQGYEAPKNLEIIRSTSNVAASGDEGENLIYQ